MLPHYLPARSSSCSSAKSEQFHLHYDERLQGLRVDEFPMLQDSIYLDNAGTVPYSKTMMQSYTQRLLSNFYGNPHSASPSSQLSTQMIDDARHDLLQFLKADPAEFDLIFVANASAGIKLVADSLRDRPGGFQFVYHNDSHTSLVGARELATSHQCLESDAEVEAWLDHSIHNGLTLFAYPAQSNMTGRRLPRRWSHQHRRAGDDGQVYSLLDAAALLSTTPLDLSDQSTAPDFTVFSLYKIFGFPDLGALVVRNAAAHVLQHRRYFGGGTVDVVTLHDEQWHAKKSGSLHAQLEDGTLPIHSIAAVKPALETHASLFSSLDRVSKQTAWLADRLYTGLVSLSHANGFPVAKVYTDGAEYSDSSKQGPIIAFNLKDDHGMWINISEIEKLATVRNIHLRTGGLCNPGGIATSLKLAPHELRENFSAGHRCGAEGSIINGKPTGVVRVSLGATNTSSDVDNFLKFIQEFFVSSAPSPLELAKSDDVSIDTAVQQDLFIEQMTVYPVKSCAGFAIPNGQSWSIGPEGMQWDREWCLVHQGTSAVLSQKQYPRMALIRPHIDTENGLLRLHIPAETCSLVGMELTVPLSNDPRPFGPSSRATASAIVCNDHIIAQRYASSAIAATLSKFLDVPCQLARFPPASRANAPSTRHAKMHLTARTGLIAPCSKTSLLLSNESPVLTICRSSLDALNEQIRIGNGEASSRTIPPSTFRANIVIADRQRQVDHAYQEDTWTGYEVMHSEEANDNKDAFQQAQVSNEPITMTVPYRFEVLGPCRRCQMVCVDQVTGQRLAEPFVTLAKTRRRVIGPQDGGVKASHDNGAGTDNTRTENKKGLSSVQGVFFGVHTALASGMQARVRVGDTVRVTGRRLS